MAKKKEQTVWVMTFLDGKGDAWRGIKVFKTKKAWQAYLLKAMSDNRRDYTADDAGNGIHFYINRQDKNAYPINYVGDVTATAYSPDLSNVDTY